MYVAFSLLFSPAKGSHWTSVDLVEGGGRHGSEFWSVLDWSAKHLATSTDLLPDIGSLCCLSISFNWKNVSLHNFSSSVLFEAAMACVYYDTITQADSFQRLLSRLNIRYNEWKTKNTTKSGLLVTREVEQTQLVRVRVRVTSLFVDDVIIICAPRTCATSYTFAWTCKLWSTRLSLRVEIVIIRRRESPLPLYQMVLGLFENDMNNKNVLNQQNS